MKKNQIIKQWCYTTDAKATGYVREGIASRFKSILYWLLSPRIIFGPLWYLVFALNCPAWNGRALAKCLGGILRSYSEALLMITYLKEKNLHFIVSTYFKHHIYVLKSTNAKGRSKERLLLILWLRRIKVDASWYYNMSTFEQYIEFESFLVWICIFIDIKKNDLCWFHGRTIWTPLNLSYIGCGRIVALTIAGLEP